MGRIRAPLLGLLVSLLGACASAPDSPEVQIAPGDYPRAFAAARDILRDWRFPIDRVDAAAGVIATNPKASSGIFTFWDPEQSSIEQEFEDSFQQQQRRVRVTFGPAAVDAAEERPGSQPEDLRGYPASLVCRFEVVVERFEHPGTRTPPKAVRYGTQTQDPELRARGMWPAYTVVTTQDPLLAARLARDLRDQLQKKDETIAEPKGTP